jgi:phospholipase D1/2
MRAEGAESGADGASVLEPGRTCWRVARAGRVAVIVDAAAYFAAAKAAILRARHSVLLIGWDFDTRIKLAPDDPDPPRGVPDELGPFLNHVASRRRGPHVFVLKWDLALAKSLFRGTTLLFMLDWLTHRRLHFRLAGDHPTGACHHLKVAVVDDAIAFCGGIDMTTDRWDTPDHRDENPRRVRPNGAPYGPFHDVATMVDGEAARALGELARERWRRATGQRLRVPPPPAGDFWPAFIEPAFRDVEVAIARTEPEYDGHPPRREIEALYLAAIRSARRTLYLESQYFASKAVADAIARRLAEEDGPEVVVVNPKAAEGWLEEKVMGSARALLVDALREADRHGRFRIYTPVTEGGADIYVHAKVVVADDRLLRVGSSNLNNRSMGFDTECDLALEAGPGEEEERRAILRVRDTLLAEHLGVAVERVTSALARHDGSLIRTVEELARPSGRTLIPFEPPELGQAERLLAESDLFNPDRAEGMADTAPRGVTEWPRSRLGAGLAAAASAVAAGWWWRRGRAGSS